MTTENDADFRREVLLSVQRALIDEITPEMRFVSVESSLSDIHIWVYIHGRIKERVKDEFDTGAVTQVAADFAYPDRPPVIVHFDFIRCDYPQKPEFRGLVVYGRKED